MAEHSIIPISEADIPTLAKFIFALQLNQATNRFLFHGWPNESAQLSVWSDIVEQDFRDDRTAILKMVDDTSGETIASVTLIRADKQEYSSEVEQLKAQSESFTATPNFREGINLEVLWNLKESMAVLEREMEGLDYYILSALYVKPPYRGLGLGKKLVQYCQEKAFAAEAPLYLGSVPSVHEFYQKLGFVDITHSDIYLTKWAPKLSGFGLYRLLECYGQPVLWQI